MGGGTPAGLMCSRWAESCLGMRWPGNFPHSTPHTSGLASPGGCPWVIVWKLVKSGRMVNCVQTSCGLIRPDVASLGVGKKGLTSASFGSFYLTSMEQYLGPLSGVKLQALAVFRIFSALEFDCRNLLTRFCPSIRVDKH